MTIEQIHFNTDREYLKNHEKKCQFDLLTNFKLTVVKAVIEA